MKTINDLVNVSYFDFLKDNALSLLQALMIVGLFYILVIFSRKSSAKKHEKDYVGEFMILLGLGIFLFANYGPTKFEAYKSEIPIDRQVFKEFIQNDSFKKEMIICLSTTNQITIKNYSDCQDKILRKVYSAQFKEELNKRMQDNLNYFLGE